MTGPEASDALLARIWTTLTGAGASRSPFNFLQLATLGRDGAPKLRTIVLRQVDPAAATLSFITDVRSPKVAEIEGDPRVSLVGFDSAASVQLRLEGQARLVTDEARRKAMWSSLRPHTVLLFRSAAGPGTPLSGPSSELPDPQTAWQYFAMVDVSADMIEWLDLSGESHLRVRFAHNAGQWSGQRIAP